MRYRWQGKKLVPKNLENTCSCPERLRLFILICFVTTGFSSFSFLISKELVLMYTHYTYMSFTGLSVTIHKILKKKKIKEEMNKSAWK